MTLPLSCSSSNSQKVESKSLVTDSSLCEEQRKYRRFLFKDFVLFLSSLMPVFHYKKIRPFLVLEDSLDGRLSLYKSHNLSVQAALREY